MKLKITFLLRLKKENREKEFWKRILSITTGSVSIAQFASVIGAPVGIVSASFSLAFSISTGIIKKLLKTTGNKKKKHYEVVT